MVRLGSLVFGLDLRLAGLTPDPERGEEINRARDYRYVLPRKLQWYSSVSSTSYFYPFGERFGYCSDTGMNTAVSSIDISGTTVGPAATSDRGTATDDDRTGCLIPAAAHSETVQELIQQDRLQKQTKIQQLQKEIQQNKLQLNDEENNQNGSQQLKQLKQLKEELESEQEMLQQINSQDPGYAWKVAIIPVGNAEFAGKAVHYRPTMSPKTTTTTSPTTAVVVEELPILYQALSTSVVIIRRHQKAWTELTSYCFSSSSSRGWDSSKSYSNSYESCHASHVVICNEDCMKENGVHVPWNIPRFDFH